MLEHLTALRQWHREGRRGVLATLVAVDRSAPRDPGAVMAIAMDGELRGSISGGCVEAALVEEAERVFAEGHPRFAVYGVSDSQAQAVGLSCGGTLRVFVDEPQETFVSELCDALAFERRLLATALRVDETRGGRLAIFADGMCGSLGNSALDETVRSEIGAAGVSEDTALREYGEAGEPHGQVRVFVQRIAPKPQMYVFGAIDFAGAMLRVGKLLGYRVTLCDARSAFATSERFPDADRIVIAWPDDFLRGEPVDEGSAIIAMTHDEKFDIPLIRAALETPAAYIGVMGSRRTNDLRFTQLRRDGVSEEQLGRLSAPIGLDLGARTPEETAIAIAAEMIALRHDRDGGRLRGGSGSLRGRPAQRV